MVAGGICFGVHNEKYRVVQLYDPIRNEWERVANTKKDHTSSPAVGFLDGQPFIAGDVNDRLGALEIFDEREGVWNVLRDMGRAEFNGVSRPNFHLIAVSDVSH